MSTTSRRRPRASDHVELDQGPSTCVIYTRISLDRTGKAEKVANQEKDCRALAKDLGLEVVAVYADNDASATSGKRRAAFEEMLKSQPEAILSWAQDRLLRQTRDLERIIDLERPVYFVTSHKDGLDLSNAAGRAVARTVSAWSTFETERKGERQRAANRHRAEAGYWHFARRPYGYKRVDGQVVQVPTEAKVLKELFQRYLSGESYRSMAEDLGAREVVSTTGVPFTPSSLQRVLNNPRYAGIVVHNGEEYTDAEPKWGPIISKATWADYEAMASGYAGRPAHLLSGIALCGQPGCEAKLYVANSKYTRPDGERVVRPAYVCLKRNHVSIREASLDEHVTARVLEVLGDPRFVAEMRRQESNEDTAQQTLEDQLADVERQRRDVVRLMRDRTLTRREAQDELDLLGAERDKLEAKLAKLMQSSPVAELLSKRSIPSAWEKLPLLKKRRIIERMGMQIVVSKGRPGAPKRAGVGRRVGGATPNLDRVAISFRADA